MKKLSTILSMVLAMGMLVNYLSTPAHAAKDAKKANVSEEKVQAGSAAAVALLDQAGQLVCYARENESPAAMLAAVEMIKRVPVRDGKKRVGSKNTDTKKRVKASKKGKSPAMTLDTNVLLNEARAWAQGDRNMLALINAEIAQSPARPTVTMGRVGGPLQHIDKVKAGEVDIYSLEFKGKESAMVVVIGDGDTDLDVLILDENDNEITKDIDETDNCAVEWTPRWTGTFKICIINHGNVYNKYLMLTN